MTDDFTLTPPVPRDPHEIDLDERVAWPVPGKHVPNPVAVAPVKRSTAAVRALRVWFRKVGRR